MFDRLYLCTLVWCNVNASPTDVSPNKPSVTGGGGGAGGA
jgi:hypothetical protein